MSGEVTGAQITLDNVGELDENAQRSFEGALDGWYESNYDDSVRTRRRLELAKVKSVEITTCKYLYPRLYLEPDLRLNLLIWMSRRHF